MTQLFNNNATTTLSASLASGATSMSVGSSGSFTAPTGDDFLMVTLIRISDSAIEVIKVTDITGTTWTIVRAQEGTTALDFVAGDKVELRVTAGFLQGLQFGRLLAIQKITSTQVYTETAGTRNCYVRAVAGGGGGGSGDITGAGQASCASAGSGGAYIESYYPVATLSGKTFTVGAGGAKGTAPVEDGLDGGTTSVSGAFTCQGGSGGLSGAAVTGLAIGPATLNSSITTGGNIINASGAPSHMGTAGPTTNYSRAVGGVSPLVTYGSGGRGGFSGQNETSGSANIPGTDGKDGVIIVYEYA